MFINIKPTIPTTVMFYARFFKGRELFEYLCWPVHKILASERKEDIHGRAANIVLSQLK